MTRPAKHSPSLIPGDPSDIELKAAIYFAVGVSSESGTKAYQLAVAGDNSRTSLVVLRNRSGRPGATSIGISTLSGARKKAIRLNLGEGNSTMI